jgi:hypothetical protein
MAKEAKQNGVPQAQPAQSAPAPEPTKEELMNQMKAALAKSDFKLVAQISRKIDTMVKAVEKAELDAKKAVLDKTAEIVKVAITKVLKPMIDSKQLDAADGVWLSWDFGDQTPTVRLTKTAVRTPRAGGGGTGKKFDVSTDSMLAKHGTEKFNDEMTYQQAYDSNTDKNWRYAIRQKLLKLEGVI